jgi:hypothetical protein
VGFKEWVDGWVGFEFKRNGLRNWWMGGLQKLITVLGRFDTYKGGI